VESDEMLWLAAEYQMVAPYSIRIPMHSEASASMLPAPGPATVRLALIRIGIELFGYDFTQQVIFPILRTAALCIKPPSRVGMTYQVLSGHKVTQVNGAPRIENSALYREFAHADSPLSVFIRIPGAREEMYRALLRGVGYWGQSAIHGHYATILSELKPTATWEDLMPESERANPSHLNLKVFVWSLTVCEQRSNSRLLMWCALTNERRSN